MNIRVFAIIIALFSLTACGGGGFGHLLGIPTIPTPTPAPAIQVTPSSLNVAAGAAATITASENAANPYFTAQSSDTTVATVAQGNAGNAFVVSGVKAGKCTITISDSYGSTASVTVTVQ